VSSFNPESGDELQALSRYLAARYALSIVNKFAPGPYRAKHASRVMSMLNKLRGELKKWKS
jgi:hypothetical protein